MEPTFQCNFLLNAIATQASWLFTFRFGIVSKVSILDMCVSLMFQSFILGKLKSVDTARYRSQLNVNNVNKD